MKRKRNKELERLAEERFVLFAENLEKETQEKEEKMVHEAAGLGQIVAGQGGSGKFLRTLIELHMNKIKEFYKQRLEIEKEVYGLILDTEKLTSRLYQIIGIGIENLKENRFIKEKSNPPQIEQNIEDAKNSLLIDAQREVLIAKGSEVGFFRRNKDTIYLALLSTIMAGIIAILIKLFL